MQVLFYWQGYKDSAHCVRWHKFDLPITRHFVCVLGVSRIEPVLVLDYLNAQKKTTKRLSFFVAGVQGLEPWALGFGERTMRS